MTDVNEFLRGSNICEFSLWSFNEGRLLVLGSDDLAYYHVVEIVFEGVEYIDASTSLWEPRFRNATAVEAEAFWAAKGVKGEVELYVLEEEFDGKFTKHFVAAESMHVSTGMVYHYERENLKPGERIAPWVRTGGSKS
ncbi:hypothetical protein [Polyangium aurulentum]|uniref:hypothetical protein n=1 Tax=Polyangium aurulentum TaxID=2567896 RepID=UPI0010AEBBE7|nr:hypothetical protein [Polyangium aurulentum]UQA63220.1 hypothetical protein E8A73_023255 [Polyangium aurulentum]